MKLNVICNAEYKILMSLSFVCREIYVRASIHIITSLELLGTLISMLEQKKQMRRFQTHLCWKTSFSVREGWLMQL